MQETTAQKPGLSFYIFHVIFGIIILASLALRFFHSSYSAFIVDELVDTQLAHQVANGFVLYSPDFFWERTPLATQLVGLVSNDTTSIGVLTKARHFMWFLGTLLFLMVGYASYKLYGMRYALISPLLLLTFSTFLDRAFRIRTDLFSTFFATPALLVLLRPQLQAGPLALAGFSLGLAFLCTQKAAYFVLAFALALIARILVQYDKPLILKTILKFGLISGVSFFLPLLAQILYATSQGNLEIFLQNCFFGAVNSGLVAETYNYTSSYLYQSLGRSPHFWFLGVLGICFGVKQLYDQHKAPSAPILALTVWTVVLLILTGNHVIKFPYIYLTVAPCMALIGALPILSFMKYLESKKIHLVSNFLAALAVVIVLALLAAAHYRNILNTRLQHQARDLMARIESITEPSDAVLDGMGLVATRKRALPYSLTKRWMDERLQGFDYPILPHLKKNAPKVMISNHRLNRLDNTEILFIQDHFVQDWSQVHVVGKTFEHTGGEKTYPLSILASTHYALLKADPAVEVRLGEEILSDSKYLEAGTYQITISGPPGKVTLKYKKAVDVTYPKPSRNIKFLTNYSL